MKNKSPETARRLSIALSNANMIPQELANASGVSKASISQYLSGAHAPSNISSGKIGKVLNVNPLWLMGFDVPMKESSELIQSEKYPRSEGWIPVVGDVAAGLPIEAIEDILDYEQIDVKLLDSADYFGLRIKGKSMEPRIKEGDVVIVRVQPDVESGEVAIVKVNGDSATCKILKKYADMLVLLPLNPTFEPQEYTKEDVKTLPVQVIGKVVELRGKF